MGLAAVACVTTTAHAQFVPGDVLAGLEFVQEGGPGRVYRVTAGGDLTTTVPDFEMPTSHPVIDVCSTDDGRVLIATSTHQTIYDITSGTPVSFATIPVDASALYCGEGEIFVASFLLASQVFDITNGGDITEVYATGIERGLVRNVDGSMWGANFTGFDPGGGVFEGIAKGSDFSAKVPAIALTDVFATTVHDRRVFAAASVNDAIVDLSDGLPKFAHAIVPGVRGLTSSDGQLWASTIEGKIFQVRASVDYTNKPAYATIPGPSLSMAVVQKCGDGLVHGREECDAGGATDECYATCKLARCGDTVINAPLGEACDDGNLESGDGCSETCELETVAGSGGSGGSGGSASSGATGGGTGGGESEDDGGSGCSAAGRAPTEVTPALLALSVALSGVLGRRRRSRASERRGS